MNIIDMIGWTGSALFAICAIPQAYVCYKQKHAHGLSWVFLITWLLGEVLTLIYILIKEVLDLPLLFNYTANLLALFVILHYKVKGVINVKRGNTCVKL